MTPTGLERIIKDTGGANFRRYVDANEPPEAPLSFRAMLHVVFTMGMCPTMAMAMYSIDPDRFMVVEAAAPDEDGWHVAVQERDGTVWDVDGAHTPEAFQAEWGDFGFLSTDDAMDAMWAAGDWQGVANHLTAPDETFGLDEGVTDNIWAVTRGFAQAILTGGDL